MKKALIFPVLILCVAMLFSCAGTVLDIESYEWRLVSATRANTELDTLSELSFDGVRMVAKNGKITITDTENGTVYNGTYIQTGTNSRGRDYSFTLGAYFGYGILSNTDFYGEEYTPTVSVSITSGTTRYTLRFEAME